MASLFSDFSFDAPSRPPGQRCEEDPPISVSPTSMSPTLHPLLPARLPTPPPCDMNDLTNAFTKQNLRIVVDPNYRAAYEPLTPPSDEDTFAHALPERPQLSTARMNSATLRMQRQVNVRMQSSPGHIKDISTLVEKMIQDEDQCNVCDRKPRSSLPPLPKGDKDLSMGSAPTVNEQVRSMPPYHRASDCIDGSTRVCKRPRMRKSTTCLKLTKRLSR